MMNNPESLNKRIAELESEVKRLTESEKNYKLLISTHSDLIIKLDPEGRYLFVSPSYCNLFQPERRGGTWYRNRFGTS